MVSRLVGFQTLCGRFAESPFVIPLNVGVASGSQDANLVARLNKMTCQPFQEMSTAAQSLESRNVI